MRHWNFAFLSAITLWSFPHNLLLIKQFSWSTCKNFIFECHWDNQTINLSWWSTSFNQRVSCALKVNCFVWQNEAISRWLRVAELHLWQCAKVWVWGINRKLLMSAFYSYDLCGFIVKICINLEWYLILVIIFLTEEVYFSCISILYYSCVGSEFCQF